MRHEPSRLISDVQRAMQLVGRDAFLAGAISLIAITHLEAGYGCAP